MFALLVVVLMVIPSVYGYTFGRGSMHDMETSDYVLHPEKDKIMTLEDMQRVTGTHFTYDQFDMGVISGSAYSPEHDYMLYPDQSTYYEVDEKDDQWNLGFTRYGPAMFNCDALYSPYGHFYGGPWH